jgi:hypothetical protein
MLARQVVSRKTLLEEITPKQINKMLVMLALFPTPFKNIYYTPTPEERRATTLDSPDLILTKATRVFLGTNDFYYSCRTAEERWAIKWQPIGYVHIVNTILSRTIDLRFRIEKKATRNPRSRRIAKILSLYGNRIIFHRVRSIEGAKFKRTPYGAYALRSQIKIDKKRFREKD